MSLEEYRNKRDLRKSPEPGARKKPSSSGNLYSIQEHRASRLHWDLRLEREGVLKSWALPKEPPSEAGIRRLAVQTEDHPVDYAFFEGEIPEGHYGAGEVRVWDRGTYRELEYRPDDKYIVDINGTRLSGTYCLIRLKKSKIDWLFFKKSGRP